MVADADAHRRGRAVTGGRLHSATDDDRTRPGARRRARRRRRRPRIFCGIQPSGAPHVGQRPRRDPQLRAPAVGVRGDLLHRRLPRADEPHDAGPACAARPARWPRRCWPSASTRALHAVRPEPPPRAHRARLAARDGHAGQLARAHADVQGEEGRTSPTTSTTACSPTRSCRPPTSSSTRRRSCPSARTRPRTSSCPARSSGRSTPATATTFPEPQAVFTEAPVVLGHGRRPQDEQVGRQHDRDLRARGRHPQAGHVDGHRHQAHPAHRSGPPGGLQRLPAPPLVRRRLRGDLGRRADRADRLRRHEAAARRPDPRALRRRARALHRADGPPDRGGRASSKPARTASARSPRPRWPKCARRWACADACSTTRASRGTVA